MKDINIDFLAQDLLEYAEWEHYNLCDNYDSLADAFNNIQIALKDKDKIERIIQDLILEIKDMDFQQKQLLSPSLELLKHRAAAEKIINALEKQKTVLSKKRRIFIDMDGTLAEWKEAKTMEVLYEEGYYLHLKPHQKLINEVKSLYQSGEEIFILSAYLSDSKYALQEKNEWLNENLNLPKSRRIFVKYGSDKSKYITDSIKKNDYLIDDYTLNLNAWEQNGGTGIKYLNGINHTKGTWQGCVLDGNNSNILDIIEQHSEKKHPVLHIKPTSTLLEIPLDMDDDFGLEH